MRPRPSNSAPRRGFTLVELMIVLVLIGVLTAVIIPEMKGSYEDALLRSTGRKLVSLCTLAYSRAISVNQAHRVRLDRKTGHYLIERETREAEGGGGFAPARDMADARGELDPRITIEFRRAGEGPATGRDREAALEADEDSAAANREAAIAFYPDGTADAGEFVLRDRERFRLAVRINPTTARVQLVELERE